MTLWHLAWMHLTVLGIFAVLGSLPFTWWYAWDYAEGERFKLQRFHFFAWRKNHVEDGLPCSENWWAHGELLALPGGCRICPRCGWREPRG